MQVIPLQATASQQVAVTLANQACKINVYQKDTGLYVDLYVLDSPIVVGVIALNANRIVRDAYFGFTGDLAFFDTQGSTDPDYTGLGDGGRYFLGYLEVGIDL